MATICQHCHLGVVQSRSGTWAGVVGPYLITLPQIRVQICDACGKVEYDRSALGQLGAILRSSSSPEGEKPTRLSTDRGDNEWLKNWSTNGT